MSRIRKTKPVESGEDIEINKVKGMIREELKKRYGGVVEFLDTPKGIELGGRKVRPYLYDTGTINFNIINAFAEYLGIGTLTRTVVVTRNYYYKLSPIPTK